MLLLREAFRRRLSFSIGLLSVMGAPSDWRFRRISGFVDILLLTLKSVCRDARKMSLTGRLWRRGGDRVQARPWIASVLWLVQPIMSLFRTRECQYPSAHALVSPGYPDNSFQPIISSQPLLPLATFSPMHKSVSHTWLHTHTKTCPQICPNHEFSFPTCEG